MIIRTARMTARVCITLIGIFLIVLALLSASARLGLPFVANYKPAIESRLSDYLRSPVAIGELNLSWEGFGPLLRAEQVSVFETSDSKVTLDELLIDLNLASSLFRGAPVINELTLVGAQFAVEADPDGQFRLHGMDRVRSARLASESASSRRGQGVDLMAWLLVARKVGLLDTTVTLIDKQADLQLVMQDLNIRAENENDVHKLRVDVQLPEELGGSLEAGIDLVGSANALASAKGDLYIKADTLQTRALTKVLKVGGLADKLRRVDSPIDTSVSLELWGQWEDGQLKSARGPISTSRIKNSVSGDYLADRASANLILVGDKQSLRAVASDVIVSMGTDTVRVDSVFGHWSAPTNAGGSQKSRTWGVSAAGTTLDVASTSRLVRGVLMGSDPVNALNLQTAQPSGSVLDWTFNYSRTDDLPRVSFDGDLYQLQSKPFGSLPGLGLFNGRISVEDSKGELTLASDSTAASWIGVSDVPLMIDSVTAAIGMDFTQKSRVLLDGDIEINDSGIHFSSRLNLTLEHGQSPHLDMQSRFAATDINAVKQWLPKKKLSEKFRNWLELAVESGSISDGSLLFFGSLSDFPFASGEGVFRASANIQNGRLAFNRKWPAAKNINGTLEVDGTKLSVFSTQSSFDKFAIGETQLEIADLKRPVLTLKGTGSGELQDVINFGSNGPLKPILQPALSGVTGRGNADMDLALTLPLYRSKSSTNTSSTDIKKPSLTLNGSLFLRGNTVEFSQANLPLQQVSGAIGFDRNGIRVNNLKAEFLGRSVRVSGKTTGTARNAITTVGLTGALEGNDVLAHYGNPLDQYIRGASKWSAELTVPHSAKRKNEDGIRLQVVSDLVGSELSLPRPLNKSTASSRRLVVNTAFRASQDSQRWDVRLGGKLHASATTSKGGMESLVIRLGGAPIPQAEIARAKPGIRLLGRADRMAADDWIAGISRFINSGSKTGSGANSLIIPVSTQLEIDSLELGSESLGAATLSMSTSSRYLKAIIKNDFLEGQIEYPRKHWSKELALNARFERIDIAVIDALNSEKEGVAKSVQSTPIDPRTLPPIEARVARFTRNAQTVKNIVLRAQPAIGGLQVTTLGFAYDTMQLVGQGYWRLKDPQGVNPLLGGQHLTRLDLVLQSDDFGSGFEHIGLNDVISKGEGSVEVQLSWPGPAYLPSMAMLDGSVKLNIERGSIIPLEPGAGKMVGLFALQALPRRLNLDFTDISDDGLAFKRITGDAQIDNGIVDVKLVQLTGPVGVVDVSGESNLNTRQFDQKITVLPRVSAALPVIGVISGGASAGVGALIATGLLKALGIDLDRIGLREYELKGTWDEPVFSSASSGNG
ncbi:MAG: YhdP family protein [Granulosicoccus sp.]